MVSDSHPHGAFPPTIWSRILRDRDGDAGRRRELLEGLCTSYWEPVFCQARYGWRMSAPDAADATQAFFADLLERGFLDDLDPSKGSLRSFLKAAFANHLRNAKRDAGRQKRGGGRPPLSLEGAAQVLDPGGAPEEAFDRAWLRLVLTRALDTLRASLTDEGHPTDWEAFEAYDLSGERVTYAQVAKAQNATVAEVRHRLHRARTRLRELVIGHVADYVRDEDEAREEVEWILG
jgi:RNA polymerase sigma-70 factor (ECF subfamily)